MSAADWPFVGRDEELGRVLSALGSAAVLVRGDAGIGKTRLAEAAVERLTGTRSVAVRIHPTAPASVAFGALVPMINDLGLDDTDERALLRSADQRARELGDRLVVLADDVARLDAGSVAVLELVLRAAPVAMVMTARVGEALPERLVSLFDEGRLQEQVLGPLAASALADVLADVLGGSVDPGAVRAVHEASAGNPLVVRELVRTAVDRGAVQTGPHGLVIDRLDPSPRLVELVERRFRELTSSERAVLELLAVGEPLPYDQLQELHGPGELDRLEAGGLVESTLDSGTVVLRLPHPIYDDVLRAAMPLARRRRRSEVAAEILLAQGSADSHLRAVSLLVDADLAVDREDLARAGRRAVGLLDHHLALRLGAAAVGAGDVAGGELLRGTALSALGHVDEAEAALRRASAVAVSDEEQAFAAQRLGHLLALRTDRLDEAIEQAELVRSQLGEERWRGFLDADLIKWRLMAGASVERPDRPDAEGAARLNDCLLHALLDTMAGRLDDADAAIREGLGLVPMHRGELPHAEDLLLLSTYLVLAFGGRLDDAAALVKTEMGRSDDRHEEPLGMWAYASGVMELHRGHARRAEQQAALAVDRLLWRDFTGVLPAARALRASALAQLGRLGEAQEVLEELGQTGSDDPTVVLQRTQAEAWLAVADGEVDQAVNGLAAAAADAIGGGHVCLGALAAYEAVRLGEPGLVVECLELAERSADGVLMGQLARHARGLLAGDVAELEDVASGLHSIGLGLGAADAMAQVALLHRRAARSELERRAWRRSVELAAGTDGARAPRHRVQEEPVLTPREREVALAAADRQRSKEIAARLEVSTRTVDNHLASAYRKLGVSGRDELAAALAEMGLLGPGRPG